MHGKRAPESEDDDSYFPNYTTPRSDLDMSAMVTAFSQVLGYTGENPPPLQQPQTQRPQEQQGVHAFFKKIIYVHVLVKNYLQENC